MNATADWLFNIMFCGAIAVLLVLLVHVFVTPILGVAIGVIGLIFVVVVAALWPQW